MWIMTRIPGTNRGAFISIVAKDRDGHHSHESPAGELSIRARRRADLEGLFPGDRVIDSGGDGDYQFRVFKTRHEVADLLMTAVEDLKYDNFKDSVYADKPFSAACARVWSVMAALQPVEPYSAAWTPRKASGAKRRKSP